MGASQNIDVSTLCDLQSASRLSVSTSCTTGTVSAAPATAIGTSRAAAGYLRRRAITACLVCRQRKIKCSNDRPKCTSCAASDAVCVYDDAASNLSSFDPASLIIIQKLNEVLLRLPDAALPPASSPCAPHDTADRCAVSSPAASEPVAAGADSEHDDSCCASAFSAVERLLEWPIFGERASSHHLTDVIFTPPNSHIDATNLVAETHLPHQQLPFASVSQQVPCSQQVTPLVIKYLLSIHSKHPFVDTAHLRACTAAVAEFGPAWDPPSCLVVSRWLQVPWI